MGSPPPLLFNNPFGEEEEEERASFFEIIEWFGRKGELVFLYAKTDWKWKEVDYKGEQ